MSVRILRQAGFCLLLFAWLAGSAANVMASPLQQEGGDDPPDRVVKLVFIHHSTGENWLADGYGDLGKALAENNYFVSDTNYGWGPNSIGDRTDIPDWEEWFRSGNTENYMQALYQEGDQHADYSRQLPDPGGENEIILFKSCFPNSDLDGNPNDPPSPDGWLTVGHAKFVYNQILAYFQQHPEKLFVVITAPPLSDRSNAANARAFNLWLVNDWLTENDYPYSNVAVFDFYNVLTGKDGHHTYQNGQVIHEIAKKDTLHYPSGDDHPSSKGSQKATEDFIPLLNYFYNRWQADNHSPLPPGEDDLTEESSAIDLYADREAPPELTGLVDDFEGIDPPGSNGWEVYWDESTPTELECKIVPGAGLAGNGLQLEYQISPHSWGTCGLYYDTPQDWSGAAGLAFMIHSDTGSGPLHVDLFADGPDGQESYLYELALSPAMAEDWIQVGIRWDLFQRVAWEEGAGTAFDKENQISGLAFGFGAEDSEIAGELYIDDVGWMAPRQDPEMDSSAPIDGSDLRENSDQETGGINLPCIGSLAAPLSLAVAVSIFRKLR